VMSENGVAMMGSATASGPERAQMAAEQAVHSPLLEDIHLSGARGVLVNITASHSMKLKEVHEVMNTIRSFTAEDATVIYGSVIDEAIGDALRVTIVATGLGGAAAQRNQPVMQMVQRTGTDDAAGQVNYDELDQPTALRRRRDVTIEAMRGLFEKEIEGFGAVFHLISFNKIKTSTMQSRATGGVVKGKYIFCLPGSPGACRDGWDEILVHQLDYRHKPCNFVEIMPRLEEHRRRK